MILIIAAQNHNLDFYELMGSVFYVQTPHKFLAHYLSQTVKTTCELVCIAVLRLRFISLSKMYNTIATDRYFPQAVLCDFFSAPFIFSVFPMKIRIFEPEKKENVDGDFSLFALFLGLFFSHFADFSVLRSQ